MITKFDKSTALGLVTEVTRDLQALCRRHDLKFDIVSGSFVDTSFTLKIRLSAADASGALIPSEVDEFIRLASHYGLQETDLHRIFTVDGKEYKIIGAKSRNRRYPIIAVDVASGQRHKWTAASVRARLLKEKAA